MARPVVNVLGAADNVPSTASARAQNRTIMSRRCKRLGVSLGPTIEKSR